MSLSTMASSSSASSSSSTASSSSSPVRVFISFFPTDDSRRELVSRQVHAHRNTLAKTAQALQLQQPADEPPATAAPFLFLFVHNLSRPLQKLKEDDVVLYVPTARYRAMVEEAEGGHPPNEEVEAVRRKALAAPHSVIAITSHPSAMDGLDSPDHIPPRWRSAHFLLFHDAYTELLTYLTLVRADPELARVYQQPPVAASALWATSRLSPYSQQLAAQPDARVRRLLAADGRLRIFLSFAANDSELTAFHPQAAQLLADALNVHSLFDCTVHSLDDTDSGQWSQWMPDAVRQAHYILFIPTARYRQRTAQAEDGVAEEMRVISERARGDERSVVCVTFPTIASPADNIPQGWPSDRYEVTGSEQSLQRLLYRLLGVEKGVKEISIRSIPQR